MSTDKVRPAANSGEIVLKQLRDMIKRIHVDLTEQCRAVERAHALVNRSPLKPAQVLVIESETLLGKTRVLDLISGHVQSAYVSPVQGWTCRATCESITDGSAFGILLCSELKVPIVGLGNMPRLGHYISKQIKSRKPRLLAIDNAHLLMKGGIANDGVLHILGAIVASGAVPVILSGRTGTTTVADQLIAMVGQTMETRELSPLPYTKGADLGQIRDFLVAIGGDLFPLLDEIGITMTLGTDDWAKRFWGGSWGSPGQILALILETLVTIVSLRAEQKNNSRYTVTREDFAEAWRLQIARHSPLKFNPFKRDDAPTLGEVQNARRELKQDKLKNEFELPKAPKGKGSKIWR
jgi:hypothetical protein